MNIDLATYKPFEHENIEIKKTILDFARSCNPNDFKDALSSTLIFVNAVDYIASHLLSNLMMMNHLITHNELNGVVYFKCNQVRGLPLGQTIDKLRDYEFPDKSDFLEKLERFNPLRITYIHKFLSLTPEDYQNKADNDLNEIRTIGEYLLNKYDIIVRGMQDNWFSYLERVDSRMTANIPPVVINEDQPKVEIPEENKSQRINYEN